MLNLIKPDKRSCFMLQLVFLSKKQSSYGEAEVTIQFHLDGYESQETSKTKIVDPPYIDSRKDSEPFVPYPPCSDKFIHIKVIKSMITLILGRKFSVKNYSFNRNEMPF